jgi:hypothetical protein
MHFLPANPSVYEEAREAVMRKRGAVIRTLYALEAVLAALDVEASTASNEDFQRALEHASVMGAWTPASTMALVLPGLLDPDRSLTFEGAAALQLLARA